MIVGIGVDVVEVERIARALSRPETGERFRSRVFTPGEIAYCESRRSAVLSYAARFAAKEATMKALGRGFGGGIGWKEIEVARDGGPPRIQLHGKARELAARRGIRRVHLSLSHTDALALAWVIAEADDGEPRES